MSCHQNALRFRVENVLCAVVFLSSYFCVCVCILLLERGWSCRLFLIAIRSAFSFGFGPRAGLTLSLIKLGTLFSADFRDIFEN